MIACSKNFTLVIDPAGCALNTCVTQDRVSSDGNVVNEMGLAYAPDLCYAMVQSGGAVQNDPLFIHKYDPDTNSLILKATFSLGPDAWIENWAFPSRWVYDALHRKFVATAGTLVLVFDPITETVSNFETGIAGIRIVYVPEKGRIYGRMGTQGGLTVVGYIDLDAHTIVQLGTIPAVGPSTPSPSNYVYCPLTNCLYGCWTTGAGASMAKFDLATNVGTGSILPGGIEGNEVVYDTDRDLIIVSFGTVKEVDPVTETIVRDTAIDPAAGNAEWSPVYVPSLKKVFGIGFGGVGDESVISYDTQSFTSQIEFNDNVYLGLTRINGAGALLTNAVDSVTEDDGVRRVCAGGDNIPMEDFPPLDDPPVTPTGDPLAFFSASVLALSLDSASDIAIWNPVDGGGRGSTFATGVGVFYGTSVNPTMGDWPKDTVLTWISRSSISGSRRFIGLRYQDNAGDWQWVVPGDLGRIWETVTDYANVNPNPNIQFQPQTYENASQEVRIEQLYDRRVLTAVHSTDGSFTLLENISYSPLDNPHYSLSLLTNAIFASSGGVMAMAIDQFGSGAYEIKYGGNLYTSATLIGTYISGALSIVVSKGGVDGWEMGGWTP